MLKDLKSVLNLTVLVAGLGYFVDLFDITLFGVVRIASLKDLGITDPAELLSSGVMIYNAQMIGMMIGGVLWGILGDRRGRLSVMFVSILLYSLANLANIFAWDATSYAACRFFGGLGLAGELGAAVTLVAESLPKEKRGLGTAIVAMLGMLGIVAAAFVGQLLPWKMSYLVGGLLGLGLLFTRFKVSESSLFQKGAELANRGNPFVIFNEGRLPKYLCCIAIGVPVYFTTGVLWTFAPELTAGLNVQGPVSAGDAILYGSIGLTIGDFCSGLISQWMKSRKRAVALFLLCGFSLMLVYGLKQGLTNTMIYALSFALGTCVGYWALLVTMAAEQFGTNIRATVATTVPNFVRGSAMFATTGFAYLRGHMTAGASAMTVGTVCFGLALISLYFLDETFARDLNYQESDGSSAAPAGSRSGATDRELGDAQGNHSA